jgi:hypothetical protein
MTMPIRFLTIHCAATPKGRDVKAATVEQWDIAKFGQKSYHHIVELDGNDHCSLRGRGQAARTSATTTPATSASATSAAATSIWRRQGHADRRADGNARARPRCTSSATPHRHPRPQRMARRQQGMPELQRPRLAQAARA